MAYRPRYICLLPAPAAERASASPPAAAEGASAKAAAAPEGPSAETAPGPSGTPEGASAEHASPAAAEAAPAECSAGGRPARWLWRSWRTGWPGPLGPSPEDGVVQHRGPSHTGPQIPPGSGSTAFRPGSPTAPAAPLAAPQRRSPGTQRPAPHSRGSPYSSTRCRWNRSPGRQGYTPPGS